MKVPINRPAAYTRKTNTYDVDYEERSTDILITISLAYSHHAIIEVTVWLLQFRNILFR